MLEVRTAVVESLMYSSGRGRRRGVNKWGVVYMRLGWSTHGLETWDVDVEGVRWTLLSGGRTSTLRWLRCHSPSVPRFTTAVPES